MGSPNENRALPGVTVINCLLGGIALIVVSLRIYTRAWVKPPLGWDDILIVLALVRDFTPCARKVYNFNVLTASPFSTSGLWRYLHRWPINTGVRRPLWSPQVVPFSQRLDSHLEVERRSQHHPTRERLLLPRLDLFIPSPTPQDNSSLALSHLLCSRPQHLRLHWDRHHVCYRVRTRIKRMEYR